MGAKNFHVEIFYMVRVMWPKNRPSSTVSVCLASSNGRFLIDSSLYLERIMTEYFLEHVRLFGVFAFLVF